MNQSTIYLNFKSNVIEYPSSTALAYIENGRYSKITYKQLDEIVLKVVNYFIESGFHRGDRVAIFSENRWEWSAVDLACNYLGIVLVPLHTTYSEKYLEYIISQTEVQAIFISNKKLFDVYSSVSEKVTEGIKVIIFDKDTEVIGGASYLGDVLKNSNNEVKIQACSDENSIFTIIYTSGTTGMPRGAILSNKNVLSNIDNVLKYVPIYRSDRFFSFLPLSHVLERVAGQTVPLILGASIYYSRSPKTLVDDIKIAKPTIMICVPRIFEKIFDSIKDKLRKGSKFKNDLFYYALKRESKLNSLKRHGGGTNKKLSLLCKILDKLVFEKVRNIFGGKIRVVISGGSSLDKRIARFFEDVGIKIIEGYGLTETSPIISVNKINDYKFGTVGFVLENLEIKIDDNKEILVRGDSVMSGYWNEEAASKNAIDDNGWFYTGDMGFLDKDGFLNIIGRKKEIIVLSTGKNIVPVNIELALNYDKYITQSTVIGNNEKFLTALIVPDFKEIEKYCVDNDMQR